MLKGHRDITKLNKSTIKRNVSGSHKPDLSWRINLYLVSKIDGRIEEGNVR
jgi:hypothetical protein